MSMTKRPIPSARTLRKISDDAFLELSWVQQYVSQLYEAAKQTQRSTILDFESEQDAEKLVRSLKEASLASGNDYQYQFTRVPVPREDGVRPVVRFNVSW